MSRLTKPLLKTAIQASILGPTGNGECQMILTRPSEEAFRQATAGEVAPGGGLLAARVPGKSGTTFSGTNVLGDTPSRTLASAPSYDPKFVSVDPYLNPYLDYLLDKISEGVATAHQEWQSRQRVRGVTLDSHRRHDNVISELETHLPFQTEVAMEDQSDHTTRGDLIDTGLRDYQPGPNPRVAALTMAVAKAQSVATDPALLGGLSVDEVPAAGPDPVAARAAVAGKLSTVLSGKVVQSPQGPVFSDMGKYQNPKGGAVVQFPGGKAFSGLFMFATWQKLVNLLIEKAKLAVPSAAKMSPRGMDLSSLAARNLTAGNKDK